METTLLKEMLFDLYMKVQFDIFKRFGIEKMILIEGQLSGIRRKANKKEALAFLGKLVDKDEEYLKKFVEVEKRPLIVRISHAGEILSLFLA